MGENKLATESAFRDLTRISLISKSYMPHVDS